MKTYPSPNCATVKITFLLGSFPLSPPLLGFGLAERQSMEAVTGVILRFGAECKDLQHKVNANAQVLLNCSAFKSTRWAAGRLEDLDVQAVAAQSTITAAAWASGAHRPQHSNAHILTCRTNTPFAAPLASLTISGISPALTTAVPGGDSGGAAAAVYSRRNCCGGHTTAMQQQHHQQNQQTQAVIPQSGGQQTKARQPCNKSQLVDLSGTWIKNRESSQSMEDAMNLMRLNGIVRQAVKLVRGVQIKMDDDNFTFTVFSFISWFKVKEVYPMTGEERHYRRRDLRRGGALGYVEPHGPDLRVQLRWSDPLGGTGQDHFRLVSEDELHIESFIEVAGQTARYLTVYDRKPDRRRRPRQDLASTEAGDEGAGSDHGGHHHQLPHPGASGAGGAGGPGGPGKQ